MADTFLLRPATAGDARVLAEHRVGMFRDIGTIHPDFEAGLRDTSTKYFASAIPKGEYFGWVAYRPEDPTAVLAGAGVQLRTLLPRPPVNGRGLLLGPEGLVLNVYVEPQWRRRGLARRPTHSASFRQTRCATAGHCQPRDGHAPSSGNIELEG